MHFILRLYYDWPSFGAPGFNVGEVIIYWESTFVVDGGISAVKCIIIYSLVCATSKGSEYETHRNDASQKRHCEQRESIELYLKIFNLSVPN